MLNLKLIVILFFNLSNWGLDINDATLKAKTENKYILINFSGSDWCGPCIKLKKEILDSEVFLKYAENKLVLVRADFPRMKKNQLSKVQTTHNENLAAKYNPKGKFPFTVLIKSNGEIIQTWDGYPKNLTTEKFISQIKTI